MTHLYATRSRPAMFGTVPPGFTLVSEEQTELAPFGTISYETQLDALTCWKYELRNLFEDYKVGDKVSWVEGGKVFTGQIQMIDEEGTMWADQYTPLPPFWNLHLAEEKPATRKNWIHHVDFYHDGTVGIDRYGQDVRVYKVTETSVRRLENMINRLCWSWRPPTKLDDNFSTLKNRAMAPMRRFR